MYRLCIFDLDGTLTDTLDSLTYSVNETMKEMNLKSITKEQCRMFVGNGSKVLLEMALEVSGDPNKLRIDEAMENYDRIFKVNCTYNVVPYEGIRELLKKLKSMNMKLAVLSNKPDREVKSVVSKIFGDNIFDIARGQIEGVPRKPDPTAVLEIAKELEVSIESVIYIGDSEVDINTGFAAKVATVGVLWGFRTEEELKKAGARCVIDHPSKLTDLM